MKRYDDVNIIKAYACLAVFGSHWFGTFGSWGSNKVNALMEIGPLPLFRYGTFGVSLFLMISGMLIADKVYSGRFTSWSSEILRRYLKLPVDGHISAGISILPGRSLLHSAGCAAFGK